MFVSKKKVEEIRKMYPEGTMVELISMGDDPQPVQPGTTGVVKHVDDAGTIHVSWSTGSSLGVIPGVDFIRIVNTDVIVRRPKKPFMMMPGELAEWANYVHVLSGGRGKPFTAENIKERLRRHHCDCGVTEEGYTKGMFRLFPYDSKEVQSGGKAYMKCEKCGGYSHL